LVGHSDFRIGDTLAEDPSLVYSEIPRFTPECFAWLQSPSTAQFKRFREGLEQLLQEGVVQSFLVKDSAQRVPLLGAVGPLQFEVVQYRMQTEYGAESRLEHGSWKILRWVVTENGLPLDDSQLPTGARIAFDVAGKPVVLFQDQWSCDFFAQRNPKVRLSALPMDPHAEGQELAAQL
jgi:peptide chain release factor 3